MNGYMGRILRVNLSDGRHAVETVDVGLLAAYLGGRGLAARLFLDEVPADAAPLSERNKVFFFAGPMVGTGALSAGTCSVVAKSPLTGTLACAKTRGHFGAELKYAGFDGLIVEGRAEGPVVLCIMDDKVVIKPAPHLWGRTTNETADIFRKEMSDPWGARETSLAVIGPAGERQVHTANLVTDTFLSVGGPGIGAVLGAKNLKAVAVKGKNSVRVADGNRLAQVVTTMIGKLNAAPYTSELMPQWGTAFLVRLASQKGMLPEHNFRRSSGAKAMGTEAIAGAFALKSRGCFACPIACLKKTDLRHPLFRGRALAPTYMAIGAMGSNLGIADLEAIGRANTLCSELGLDPVATGGLMATAMEMTEAGVLAADDLGLSLRFGDDGALLKGIELLAAGDNGFAGRMRQGGEVLAADHACSDLFMGVRGSALAPFEPRAIQGMGLHYATSVLGPHHAFGHTFLDELLGVHEAALDPFEAEGKPELVKQHQDMIAALDSLGFCTWILMGLKPANLAPMVNAVLGTQLKADDLLQIGERIWNTERLVAEGHGRGRGCDQLPRRFLDEPLPDGPAKGQVSRLPEMLPRYFELRGWTGDGLVRPDTLERLGIGEKGHA